MKDGRTADDATIGPFCFRGRTRTWSLRDSGRRTAGVSGVSGAVEVNGRLLSFAEAECAAPVKLPPIRDELGARQCLAVDFRFPRQGFELRMTFEVAQTGACLFVHAAVRNTGDAMLVLGACRLMALEAVRGGRIALGPEPDRQTFFCATNDQYRQKVVRVGSDGGKHHSAIIGHLYNPAGECVLNTSFLTFDQTPVTT